MAKIDGKTRSKIEALIYKTFDALDKTRTNSEHYKKIFAKMNNDQFYQFIALRFPYRFHTKPFEIEPDMDDISNACDVLKIPLLEKVHLPYLYQNKDGKSVTTKECLVIYIPIKKVKQFITKKNAMSVDISQRDMKTGLLTGHDKNGKTSDREMESLVVMGLERTMEEYARPKADAMKAKNIMYNIINNKGQVSLEEIPIDIDDSLAKNLLNTYLIGSLLNSNLINQDYYLQYTLRNKKKAVVRI